MIEHDYSDENRPAELVIGQGQLIQVTDWADVWTKLGKATENLPWATYVAWVLFDGGAEIIAASADSKDTFIARYGKGPGMLQALYGGDDD